MEARSCDRALIDPAAMRVDAGDVVKFDVECKRRGQEDDMCKAAGIAVVFGAIAVASAGAQTSSPSATARVQTRIELVATSHTPSRKAKRTKAAAVQTAPPHTVWTGPDPTKGPGIERLRQLQREGRCVIDEGYGRFSYCSDR